MHIESVHLIVNDPLLFPCAAGHFIDALKGIHPERAETVGIGYYDGLDPLLGKYRPPVSADLGKLFSGLRTRIALTSATFSDKRLRSEILQPFRYRNWMFSMAGDVDVFEDAMGVDLPIPTYIRRNIKGPTKGETLFHQFLSFLHRQGLLGGDHYRLGPLRDALKSAISQEVYWTREGFPSHSICVSDGTNLIGATLGRPVHMKVLDGLSGCDLCGGNVDGESLDHPHLKGVAILDTSALPSSEWETVAPDSIFQVNHELKVETYSI